MARYPVYACMTGEHNNHRSFRAAAHCFKKADDALIAAGKVRCPGCNAGVKLINVGSKKCYPIHGTPVCYRSGEEANSNGQA